MQRRCIRNKKTKRCRTAIKKRRTTRSRRASRRARMRGGIIDNNNNMSFNIPQNDSVHSFQTMNFDDISDEELAREIENSLPSFISRTDTTMSRISNQSNQDGSMNSSMASEGDTDAEIDDSNLLNITPMSNDTSVAFSLSEPSAEQSSISQEDETDMEMSLSGGRRQIKRKRYHHTMHRPRQHSRRKTKKIKRT